MQIADIQDELHSMAARQAVTETILLNLFAFLAATGGDPKDTIAPVMFSAEEQLRRAQREAEGQDKERARRAVEHFAGISQALIAYIARAAPPAGRA